MLQPWIFFIEGSITVVAAMVAFFFLPNTPGSAKFLSEDEQWIAAHRLRVDMQGGTSSDHVEEEKFSWQAVSHHPVSNDWNELTANA
jgi:hypothetical protein